LPTGTRLGAIPSRVNFPESRYLDREQHESEMTIRPNETDVRNVLIHGATTFPKELAAFCEEPYSLGFDFVEGRPPLITLLHLQSVESFCNQLLSTLNLALVELARPEAKQVFLRQFEREHHGDNPEV
jgi:hypothetical protein